SDRTHFKGVMSSGDFYVGEYIIGRVIGQSVLPVGYPVRDDAGRVRGMVLVSMRVEWLAELAREKPLPPGATMMVLDRHGTIMVRTRDAAAWRGKPAPELLRPLIAANQTGNVEGIDADGVQRVLGFVPVGTHADGLYVAYGVDEAAIFADFRRDLREGLILTVLSILAAAAIAWSGGGAL